MSFLDELQKTTNHTLTENLAKTNISTLNPLLDFFALAGAMRSRPEEAVRLFEKAYLQDKLIAVRTLFYLRDIRGGQGERSTFRECLKHLYKMDKDVARKVLKYVSTYGRYDDLFEIDDDSVPLLVASQLEEDERNMAEGKSVSLLAKWMPSENTSSKKTRKVALKLAKQLDLKPSQYRRKVVALRKYIKLLEQKMSANLWGDVEYGKTPSQALRKHVKAFKRHDNSRYSEYLENVKSGEEKINTSTLYTYEIFETISSDEESANVMWDNLPDYTSGRNALVVADVSGSMSGRPMSVSVSLALYFAERNQGAFNGYFMTFTSDSRLVRIAGNTLAQKLRNIESADWHGSTNIMSAFRAILNAAQKSKATPEEMPSTLYVISDMEFDQATDDNSETNFEVAQREYKQEGYELPHLVFWNVDARNTQVPATKYDNKVTLISGLSTSTFKYAVEGKTPEELMISVVTSDRYKTIEL